uniref:Transmembrane protein 82 n=1 Tax=Latimeria chalumnae TaxID=7897 RepID=H2ZSS6_LATCH
MISYLKSWLPSPLSWVFWVTDPVDCFLQGLIGACAVSVLCSLIRIHLFVLCSNNPDKEREKNQLRSQRQFLELFHFFLLSGIFAIVGARVASLVVLEFSLRAVSMLLSQNKGGAGVSTKLFLLCQYSLGCGMTTGLSYLYEGASHRTLCLVIGAGLAGLIMWYTLKLVHHILTMYELHSKQRYCGICIFLLTTWHSIPKLLCNMLKVTFGIADFAAIYLINKDFLSTSEAIRFWTPLTICYTLLVIYMQEEQQQSPTEQMVYQTVFVRMGGLLILTLTVGNWMDVFHIIVSLVGEGWCLFRTGTMLRICHGQPRRDEVSPSYPARGFPESHVDTSQ